MGSFHLNCSVSGLTIAPGDVCVIVPIHVPENLVRLSKDMYFGGPFEVADVPKVGSYDDYGGIELPDGTNFAPMDDNIPFAAIKGEVWDLLRDPIRDDWDSANGINDVVLELLGFVEVNGADTGDGRYNRLFVHSSSSNVFIASDGRWIRTLVQGHQPTGGLYRASEFIKWWHKRTGHMLDDSAMRSKKTMYPTVEHELREVLRDVSGTMFDYNVKHFGRMIGCEKLIDVLIKDESGPEAMRIIDQHLDLLCDLLMVVMNLNSLGLMLRPTVAGPQCGDYPAQVKYHSAIAAIAAKELAARDTDYEEEEG